LIGRLIAIGSRPIPILVPSIEFALNDFSGCFYHRVRNLIARTGSIDVLSTETACFHLDHFFAAAGAVCDTGDG
jgi:hypothetical protein